MMRHHLTRFMTCVMVGCLLSMLMNGCSIPGLKLHSIKPSTPALTEKPIASAFRPYLTSAIWFDISSSVYPSANFTKAINKAADTIDEFIAPNEDGSDWYIGLLGNNSFASDSIVMLIHTPALPADPAQPLLQPLPPPTTNAFQDSDAKAKIEEINNVRLANWQETLKRNHELLSRSRADLTKQTDALRKLAPPVDTIATDVFGALERSSLYFQSAPQGEKHLVIAGSDLVNNTLQQDTGSLQLQGVRVRILYHVCNGSAPDCTANDDNWKNTLLKAGATDILFLDPAASQARTTMLA